MLGNIEKRRLKSSGVNFDIIMTDYSIEKGEKLSIDKPTNFNFHAAFLAYSKVWDANPNEDIRIELNKLMQMLVEKKVNYSTFYSEIGQYQKEPKSNDFSRRKFKTKKKYAWRKSEAKKIRISRHKK